MDPPSTYKSYLLRLWTATREGEPVWPQLVEDLKKKFGTDKLTVRTEIEASIDFGKSTLTADGKTYKISPVGEAAQELVVEGGLENWVKARL